MQAIDEITRKRVSTNRARRIVVQHLPGMIVFGYSTRSETQVPFLAYEKEQGLSKHLGDYELLKDVLVYSNMRGMYLSTVDLPDGELLTEIYSKGQGSFPYSFNRKYEAVESFNIFAGKQHLVDGSKKYPISSFLKYTFGLEFETSQGYVPENICFRDGLIPLRDGSISGLEYSTVVLQGNDGISMLKQQLETLKKYTSFNKECSLHVHLGGFPLDPDKLFRVCVLCKNLEYSIQSVVPRYTFRTSEYKKSGKDYCLPLKQFRDFKQMYEHLVGRRFYGSFTQPHPNDIRREAKWRIPTR